MSDLIKTVRDAIAQEIPPAGGSVDELIILYRAKGSYGWDMEGTARSGMSDEDAEEMLLAALDRIRRPDGGPG